MENHPLHPVRRIVIMGLVVAINNCSIWIVFPFLPFMVSAFFPEYTERDLGYQTGIQKSWCVGKNLDFTFVCVCFFCRINRLGIQLGVISRVCIVGITFT